MSSKNGTMLDLRRVEVFACALARGLSQSDALREALPNSKRWKTETIHQEASRWAADRNVRARVAEIQAAGAQAAELDVKEILEEVRRIALSDIAGIVKIGADGKASIKLPHELDAATRAAVASFKIDEFGRIEYKFWDKNAALDKAMKHLGLYEADNKQQPPVVNEIRLVAMKPRAAR